MALRRKYYQTILLVLQSIIGARRLAAGGTSHAPDSPLSTKVDTSLIKVSKQADTKNIGKGLFLSADNSKAQVL